VTRFRVLRSFLDHYEIHQVGSKTILEYWIPAEDLTALNASIVGLTEVKRCRALRPALASK